MRIKFTEDSLEKAIIALLGDEGFVHQKGDDVSRADDSEVLLLDDLRAYLQKRYQADDITDNEVTRIVAQLRGLSERDLYESNKTFCQWLSNGFLFKRDDTSQKDLYIELIDTRHLETALAALFAQQTLSDAQDANCYKVVNQLTIVGAERQSRRPDAVIYVNGLPLVVFEFKSAVSVNATLFSAWQQICVRYRRDIPKVFVYNALCVISDGVNNKIGNVFAPYEFFYGWRKVTGFESDARDGIDSLHTLINGLCQRVRLLDVVKNFVFFPDTSHEEIKICCRYPQYYAARKLFYRIEKARKPQGDGKGGTYFGATGCGKSYTMLFLSRLLMKSVAFSSPTLVLITDRTDLDEQLGNQFAEATKYIGDERIEAVESRADLREKLAGIQSGGVFLTTIHKFTEDASLLSERTNIICISDEAHRSQVNLDKKVSMHFKNGAATGIHQSFGFAKYLHDSLPNATYVGFTGTPIDATFAVFGPAVDSYTMTEAVEDGITVPIVYEGRAAKVFLDNQKLKEIEDYYAQCEQEGANEYQIEESKKASANMLAILGDPERLSRVAEDFISHYEARIAEGATVDGKAMFVCASREIAYAFYQIVKRLRPDWFVIRRAPDGVVLDEEAEKALLPLAMVQLVMTRGKDDPKELWDLLGTKEHRETLAKQFKNAQSNFKIAIVVDMWLTGFDVPPLDTIYIDKPLKRHNLIQTISRVNRKYQSKNKGLMVDYIGIKARLNEALHIYGTPKDGDNFEDIQKSLVTLKDYLDLLAMFFHEFDSKAYFSGEEVEQLDCLNQAAEFVLRTKKGERRFMDLVKRLKAAYDICCGSEELTDTQRDYVHFYLAIRSIIAKLTTGDAPDAAQMNGKVRKMVEEALHADGVEVIVSLGKDKAENIDIFDPDYLARIEKIKLPNTKIQLLEKMLQKAIGEFKKVNKLKGIDFSQKLNSLVERYNERHDEDILSGEEFAGFANDLTEMIVDIAHEMDSFKAMGIDMEEKAFFDILVRMREKYEFSYPDDKMLEIAKEMKIKVDNVASYPDWSKRDDIKAQLKADLIVLLHKFGYPPVANDDVYKNVLEQAENYKKYHAS